jgi:phosphohistidine phosphatase SixA
VIKNIFIVRHGHADFSSDRDFDRVLTFQGIKAVNKTVDFINKICDEMEISIDHCISSAANRTKQTAEIICFKSNIQTSESYQELYSTVASSWIDRITESIHENLVVVGHNPTFSQLVSNLSGHEIYMQPANCAFISLEIKPDGIIYPARLNEFYNNE